MLSRNRRLGLAAASAVVAGAAGLWWSRPAPPPLDPRAIPPPPDVAAASADAQTSRSGLASKVLTPGTGTTHPAASDLVTVQYVGWTSDGLMFDASETRGHPSTLPLDETLPGWTEGVQQMVVGEKRRFWIPEALAYQGQPGRPRGDLVFDVALLWFGPPPRTPPDVASPPADAEVMASGLASRVLRSGTGSVHPTETSTVTVHYSGWTTDGEMFDSSVTRGEPATFRLTEVIAGWIAGVQLMVEGEQRRLWIPEALAYKGREGQPAGMLVFDVELIAIDAP